MISVANLEPLTGELPACLDMGAARSPAIFAKRLLPVLLCLALPSVSPAQSATLVGSATVELSVSDQPVVGAPLHVSEQHVVLLERDGRIRQFRPELATQYRVVSDGFAAYSQSEQRTQLLREFGSRFDVSGTGHFLVVHPAGDRDLWSNRFEELYRSFVRYMTARGFQPRPLTFTLVAVVFPRRADFLEYARRDNVTVADSMLGYYSNQTNRIVMYDVTRGNQDAPNWQVNAATIIHEAAHQTAFNIGVHSRLSPPPRWLSEGVGTLFEARGVYDSQRFPQREARINRSQLNAFRDFQVTRRSSGFTMELVGSDRPFQTHAGDAYAEAWAFTFFLAETEPRKFSQYLAKVAARPPFASVRSPERLQEFTSIFGDHWEMLEARFLRFTSELK